jgi:predicted metal-dependent peptidase
MRYTNLFEAGDGVNPEMFDNTKKGLGEVKFLTSQQADAHVQKAVKVALAQLAKVGQNMTEQQFWQKLMSGEDYTFLQKAKTKSPILYDTIALNAIESGVFNMMKGMPVEGAPKYQGRYFNALVDDIRSKHKPFMQLHNWVDKKYISNPQLLPNTAPGLPKQLVQCPTACATPQGLFVFNVQFMQDLLNYAYVKGLKPKSKIFKTNGGPIPDEYAYIEFLILHELMHFKHADFHYQKLLKADGKIINWVGDFRSNYLLVKSGYEQLPIGLYSDQINYDRQGSYKEMYELVKREMDKFKDEDKNKAEEMMDNMTDEHQQSEDDGSGDGQNDSNKDQQGDKEGKGQGDKGGKGEGDKKPGQGKGGDMSDDELRDAMDRAYKETEEGMTKAGEEAKGDQMGKAQKQGGGGRGVGDGKSKAIEKSEVRPPINWRALIKKMISQADHFEPTTSYTKMHRNTAAKVTVAVQSNGPSAVQPGERDEDDQLLKIAFIVDSSGSMSSLLPTIYNNISLALKTGGTKIPPEFMLIKFSSGHESYACNAKKRVGVVATPKQYLTGVNYSKNTISTDVIFKTGEQGATNYTGEMTSMAKTLANAGFNVMIFTDSDILSGHNLDEVKKTVSACGKKFFLVLDSLATYQKAEQNMPSISNNISCM